jgi:hypothetical protein
MVQASESSETQIIHCFDWPEEENQNIVEFRLVYSGELLSDAPARDKHSLRRQFHPQLRNLWKSQRNLRELAADQGYLSGAGEPGNLDSAQFRKAFDAGIANIAENWSRIGFRFVPLITREACLRCSLDILILRREPPGRIYMKGDIDGRLKTVFDALRMPGNLAETENNGPGEGEDPFFILLEDDELISEISVTTDHLLLYPPEEEFHRNYASLLIKVKIQTTTPVAHGWAFE